MIYHIKCINNYKLYLRSCKFFLRTCTIIKHSLDVIFMILMWHKCLKYVYSHNQQHYSFNFIIQASQFKYNINSSWQRSLIHICLSLQRNLAMATDRVGQKQMVQIFPLFETYSNDYLFHLFPQVHIYKIVKNYIIMQSIQVSFLCVFCIRKYIKNGGINFGLSRLAIFVWLGILSIMVKHAVGRW